MKNSPDHAPASIENEFQSEMKKIAEKLRSIIQDNNKLDEYLSWKFHYIFLSFIKLKKKIEDSEEEIEKCINCIKLRLNFFLLNYRLSKTNQTNN